MTTAADQAPWKARPAYPGPLEWVRPGVWRTEAGQVIAESGVFIPGVPVPQGSTRAFVRGTRAIVTADNAKTKPWRADVQATVRAVVGPAIVYPDGGVQLALVFVMPRRAAEPKRITPAHTRKPDLDKLARAALDALTGLVYTDDSQVVRIDAVKRTAAIGEQPGMFVQWTGVPS